MEPERLDFELVGARPYVRSTDVLRALLLRFPAKDLTLKFLRPLTGPADLSGKRTHNVAVNITSGGSSYVLSNAADTEPTRVASRPARLRVTKLHLAGWFIFLFPPRASIADRIERCFDIVHPQLGETFVVRSIHIKSPRARLAPLLWFRIHRAKSPDRAHLTMRTPFGTLAEISFKLAPKR